jgi:hypothetical protein
MLTYPPRVLATLLATGIVVAVGPSITAAAAVSTRTTLSPGRATLHYGASVRLTTRVSGPLGDVEHRSVTFWAERDHGPWRRVATVTTDDNGVARLQRHLHRTSRWQVRFAGDTVNDGSRSPVAKLRVLPPPRTGVAFGRRVVREAAAHRGAPYQYGASGPHAFDCSGFTMFVFDHFHVSLPHNAAAQYDDNQVKHVSRSHQQLGDLIFFYGSGGIYHVGIYAGHGRMWAAPHTGDHVRKEPIYTNAYLVGRVH